MHVFESRAEIIHVDNQTFDPSLEFPFQLVNHPVVLQFLELLQKGGELEIAWSYELERFWPVEQVAWIACDARNFAVGVNSSDDDDAAGKGRAALLRRANESNLHGGFGRGFFRFGWI